MCGTDMHVLEDKRVELLISNGTWDLSKVLAFFDSREAELIVNTPLPTFTRVDTPFWPLEVSGKYSVKSAYRALSFTRVLKSLFINTLGIDYGNY